MEVAPPSNEGDARYGASLIARSSNETDLEPTFVAPRTTEMNSCPAAVTLVSVLVDVQDVGSGAPSSQILNWIVEPLTRSLSHCFPVVTT